MSDDVIDAPFRVLSLFSGCGGLDIPFAGPRYTVVKAFDSDSAAVRCLRANLDVDAEVMDVTTPAFADVLERMGEVDVVLGGFPCQGFSKAGPKRRDDPRNRLYEAMLAAVRMTRPALFLAENVDGIAQNFSGQFVRRISDDFQSLGYEVDYRILNAVNFGVPQYRRRIFFAGVRRDFPVRFSWPKETHGGGSRNGEFRTQWDVAAAPDLFRTTPLPPPRTVADAIADLLDADAAFPDHVMDGRISETDAAVMRHVGEGQKLCNVRFSDTSVYTWDIPEVFGETTEREQRILLTIGKNRRRNVYGSRPNGNPLRAEDISLLMEETVAVGELGALAGRGFLKQEGDAFDLKGAMFCSGIYKRPVWDEPSPTVLTVFGNPRFFFHPKRCRPFTVRECARLQSFPDSFRFIETGVSPADAYRLIGNAVPPALAQALERQVRQVLSLIRSIPYAAEVATA
jgi:DNA (cytosine-5)-methyltransferase 1